MKKFMLTSLLLTLFAAGPALMAQGGQEEYLGLPGDNLNLYAVMKLFQESETLEGFERSLNDKDSRINNLDLDADHMVDYIRVIDNIDGNVHTIVLQVAFNQSERQDVAAFTVQRFDDGQVFIQLIGDEALYGKNYIIEPYFDQAGQTPNPGYTGNARVNNGNNLTYVRTTTYELAAWPVVRYIYLPSYRGWHSSWYFGYYPPYWSPWRPYYYHYYYGYHHNWNDYYRRHYRHWDRPRYQHYNDFYYIGHRSYSPNVSVRIKNGAYKTTYSRPDQRRDGEELYRKSYPAADNRTQSERQENSTVRRTSTQTDPARKTTGTVTNRRSSVSSTTRTDSDRKSTGTVTNRRSSGSATVAPDKSNTTRQSRTTVTRTRTSTTTTKNQGVSTTNRRSESKVSKSAPSVRKSTGRSSGETTKSGDSDNKRETRRR